MRHEHEQALRCGEQPVPQENIMEDASLPDAGRCRIFTETAERLETSGPAYRGRAGGACRRPRVPPRVGPASAARENERPFRPHPVRDRAASSGSPEGWIRGRRRGPARREDAGPPEATNRRAGIGRRTSSAAAKRARGIAELILCLDPQQSAVRHRVLAERPRVEPRHRRLVSDPPRATPGPPPDPGCPPGRPPTRTAARIPREGLHLPGS